MTIKVLAIGDSANLFAILSKYVKDSKIHIINFPRKGAAKFTYSDKVEFFESARVIDCVKKINEIKGNFDICITMGVSAYLPYLAGLNYIIFFVGDDIRVPNFIKNSKLPHMKEPLHKLNFFERKFYKSVVKNATACVAGGDEFFSYLKKFRNDAIRIDRTAVDISIFNTSVKPIKREKSKFTFFSPERFGIGKGFNLLWEALPLCKSDFEILQVEWFDERTNEEKEKNRKLYSNKPPQVKGMPLIKSNEMSRFYMFSDAVIGDLRSWSHQGGVEREAGMCKKPVISFQKSNARILLDGELIIPPYYPNNRDATELAGLIDKIVLCKDFREKLIEKQHNYIKELANPEKVAIEWENLFKGLFKKNNSIKKDPEFLCKFRLMYLRLVSKLHI